METISFLNVGVAQITLIPPLRSASCLFRPALHILKQASHLLKPASHCHLQCITTTCELWQPGPKIPPTSPLPKHYWGDLFKSQRGFVQRKCFCSPYWYFSLGKKIADYLSMQKNYNLQAYQSMYECYKGARVIWQVIVWTYFLVYWNH